MNEIIKARIFCQDTGKYLPENMNCAIAEPTEGRATISFSGEPTNDNPGYEVKLACGTTGWVLWIKSVNGAVPLGISHALAASDLVRSRFLTNLSQTLSASPVTKSP